MRHLPGLMLALAFAAAPARADLLAFESGRGAAYITDRTENLGTHPRFQWRFALGWRVGCVDLALAQIHYSNGKSIFGWNGTNVGDNFLTLQIGYLP